jgi:hypothetical protein
VVILFYQTQFFWTVFGWFLPAMPLLRVCIGLWIMLPQFKGEFYLYNMILDKLLIVEKQMLSYRCVIGSNLVSFFNAVQIGSLKFALSYISEECIVKTLEQAQETQRILREEIAYRCDGEVPTVLEDEFQDLDEPSIRSAAIKKENPLRDSYIMKEQSNARMKLNETIDLSDISFQNASSVKDLKTPTSPIKH